MSTARALTRHAAEATAVLEARQNLWKSDYAAIGKELFYQPKTKKTKALDYRTFTFVPCAEGLPEGTLTADFLEEGEALSLMITTAGAVTATLTHPTGKYTTKNKKKVETIYKPTWTTVLLPLTPASAGAEAFSGRVNLYFPASPANNFPALVVPFDLAF